MDEDDVLLEHLRQLYPIPKKVNPIWPTNLVSQFIESDTGGNSRRYLGDRLQMEFEAFADSVKSRA